MEPQGHGPAPTNMLLTIKWTARRRQAGFAHSLIHSAARHMLVDLYRDIDILGCSRCSPDQVGDAPDDHVRDAQFIKEASHLPQRRGEMRYFGQTRRASRSCTFIR